MTDDVMHKCWMTMVNKNGDSPDEEEGGVSNVNDDISDKCNKF